MEPSKRNEPAESEPTIAIGRYVLHREIARGGMATIHFGRLLGDEGFSRIVAVKRLHPELAQDEQFVAMFLSEARIASRVQHRNVVPVLDVATVDQEVILVQEYVHGVPLDLLLAGMRRDGKRLPIELAVAIACQLLAGLQATHDTVDELGQPMHIVHRDVSPQNVMIAVDGSARLLDFGIATTGIESQATTERTYKGKLAYSAPEQLQRAASPQSDIYSASVLLWELLVGERMHGGKKGAELVPLVLRAARPGLGETLMAQGHWDALSEAERSQLTALEPIVGKGLASDLSERWPSAREMEEALAACVPPAPERVLAEWAKETAGGFLAHRARILALEEQRWRKLHPLDSRTSDPGMQAAARSARSSIPPDGSAHATPPARSAGSHKLAFVAGGSVALACAFALLWFTSFEHPLVMQQGLPRDHAQPAQARPAASRRAPMEVAVPAPASEPTTVAPLALPARGTSEDPPATTLPWPGAADDRPAQATASPAGVQPGAPNVLRAVRSLAKEVAPASEPAALKESDDCAVPYYFEGKKKIFKSACI